MATKGYALAKSGKVAEARDIIQKLQNLSTAKYVPPYNFAIVYNGLGETETTLDYLKKAFAEKNVMLVFLKVNPRWNNLKCELALSKSSSADVTLTLIHRLRVFQKLSNVE